MRTIRTPAQFCEQGLALPEAAVLDVVAARYAVALPNALAQLIDRHDPQRSNSRQFIPNAAELDLQPGELSDPIGDEAYSPIEGVVHRYPDRVLLKLTHICAVYCRFCFRREMVGPDKPNALSPKALAPLGLVSGHILKSGRYSHRRRPAGAVGATLALGHEEPCRH